MNIFRCETAGEKVILESGTNRLILLPKTLDSGIRGPLPLLQTSILNMTGTVLVELDHTRKYSLLRG